MCDRIGFRRQKEVLKKRIAYFRKLRARPDLRSLARGIRLYFLVLLYFWYCYLLVLLYFWCCGGPDRAVEPLASQPNGWPAI
jgi:hypothetical protein